MSEYQVGTTVVLQAVYYNKQNQPIDADSLPSVEIRDAKNRTVQTGLISTKIDVGTYECKFKTTGLVKGTYYYVFKALFGGYPDEKAGSFILKDIAT